MDKTNTSTMATVCEEFLFGKVFRFKLNGSYF